MAVIMLLECACIPQTAEVFPAAVTASAAAATGGKYGSLKWSYNKDNGVLTISGKGAMPEAEITEFMGLSQFPWDSYKSKIQSLVVKSGVTSICSSAFYGCSKLKKIDIASTVTSVGAFAFEGTKWLNSQPDGAVYINKMFYTYKGVLGSAEKFKLKSDTKSICPYAFVLQEGMTSITIPASVSTIGDAAFYGCTSLKAVTIENGVKTIGTMAFAGCPLRSVTIPKSVTKICFGAFDMCDKLKTVKLYSGLKTIEEYAFENTAIESVTIPDTVSVIGDYAFANCSKLSKITVSSANKKFSSKNGVLYNKNKTSLLCYPAALTATSFSVPSTVETIGNAAFAGNKKIETVKFSKNTRTIGESAFESCTRLKALKNTDNILYVYDSSIMDSKWFNAQPKGFVYLGKSFIGIKGETAAYSEIALKSDTVSIAPYALASFDEGEKHTVKLNKKLRVIGEGAFNDNDTFSEIVIPSSVKEIGAFAFSDCNGIKTLTVPKNVTKIGMAAFSDFDGAIETVIIENPVCEFEDGMIGAFSEGTVVKGLRGSTAQAAAKESGATFKYLSAVSVEQCSVYSIKNQKYTGKEIKPTVTVKYGGSKLTEGKHYTVKYSNNKKKGTATVTITGNSKYGFTGTRQITFKIVK